MVCMYIHASIYHFGNVLQEGRTPLHIAATNDRRKAIEALVNAGATLDIPDKVRVMMFCM